jgi:hypothetical protein
MSEIEVISGKNSILVDRKTTKLFSTWHTMLENDRIELREYDFAALSNCVKLCEIQLNLTEKGLEVMQRDFKRFMTLGTYKKFSAAVRDVIDGLSMDSFADLYSVAQCNGCGFVVEICAFKMAELIEKSPEVFADE